MKSFKVLIFVILLFLLGSSCTFAEGKINIVSSKEQVGVGEEFEIKVNLSSIPVASFTLEIYWDNTKLEALNMPENSNIVDNVIRYTWVSDNGKNNESIESSPFIFKAITEGNTSIVISGEFYSETGEQVIIENSLKEIKIGNEESNTEQLLLNEENVTEENVPDNNSKLKIMRLEYEGIVPEFNPDILEYYITVDTTITGTVVTAIPENKEANVTVTGNENWKNGLNTIIITVESKDKSTKTEYKIYVTKTDNKENANADLETLAIKEGMLEPEYYSNITKYKVEVPNDITSLTILAIPQKEKANVKITGHENLVEGDNKIEITVTAENGITTKTFEIIAHRRNAQEEAEYKKEHEVQVERLSALLGEENNITGNDVENLEENNIANENNQENKKNNYILVGVGIIIVIALSGVMFYVIKKKKM